MPGATPITGDIIQVRAVCFTITQIALNVTHWRVVSTAGAGQTLLQIAAKISTDVSAAYKALMNPNASFRGIGCTNLTGVRTVEEAYVADAGPGSIAGFALVPHQVTALISFRTGSAGRHFQGRIYPGFLSSSYVGAEGELTVGGRTAVETLRVGYGLVKTVALGGDQATIQLVLLHRPTPSRPIPPNSQSTDVTSSLRSEGLATQRRRGDFGKTNQPPF